MSPSEWALQSEAVRAWRAEGSRPACWSPLPGRPGTFVPSLVPRSTPGPGHRDRSATTLSYVLTVGTQDAIEAGAGVVRAARRQRRGAQRTATLALDLAIIPVGLIAQRVAAETPRRAGAARPAPPGGVADHSDRCRQCGLRARPDRCAPAGRPARRGRRIARFPIAVPRRAWRWRTSSRRCAARAAGRIRRRPARTRQALAPLPRRRRGGGGGRAHRGGLRRAPAGPRSAGTLLGRLLPGPDEIWRQAGHAVCLGGLVAGGTALFHRAIHKIEAGTMAMEPILENSTGHRWIVPERQRRAGQPGRLGHPGARRAPARLRAGARGAGDRPPGGVPDLSIETVMGEPAKATPGAGVRRARQRTDRAERVDLALAEMDRTGAWDRSLLMLISPTGTGYVNYCATAAAVQYLTRGDVATVTMQYSKRPSPLSLVKIKDAREQNRLLWLRDQQPAARAGRARARGSCSSVRVSAPTPARTCCCTGAPSGRRRSASSGHCGSGRRTAAAGCTQVTGPPRPDVDPDVVAVVNDFGQIEAMPPERAATAAVRAGQPRQRRRHEVRRRPDRLATALARTRTARRSRRCPERARAGMPARMRWRPLTTFLQSLVDMKNAQIPGAYRASAHDYRPDLARFVSEVFDLPASDRAAAPHRGGAGGARDRSGATVLRREPRRHEGRAGMNVRAG